MWLCHYQQFAANIEFKKNTFDFSKTTYEANIRIRHGSRVQNEKIRVSAPNGHYPALRIMGANNLAASPFSYVIEVSSDNHVIGTNGGFGQTSDLNVVIENIEHSGDNIIPIYGLGFSGTVSVNDDKVLYFEIDADFPIFASGRVSLEPSITGEVGETWGFNGITTDEQYINEIYGGNFDHASSAINYEDIADTIPTNKEYFIFSQVKRNNEVVEYKAFKFAILPDAKISLAHVNDNWILQITEMPYKYIDLSEGGYSSIGWSESNSLLSNHVSYPYNEDYTSGGDNYSVWLYTNIPRFDSQEDREKYNNDEIGIDGAIDGGGSYKTSPIGEEENISDIDTSTFDSRACGSNIYLMSNSEMMDLKEYLFDPNHKTSLQDGLWLWGNTPASVIIGLFYVPFSVADFYQTASAGVKFGSHVATDLGFYTIGTIGGKRKLLFQMSFEGKYGDFRDYDYMTYELYLPFVGRFITLDTNRYLNKVIRCEMLFDAYKHEIRYYLYANGVIEDRIDCVCGVDMPLISTDNVSKAKTDISSRFDDINNMAQGITGAMQGRLGFGSIVSSVTGLVENKMIRAQKPTETIQGGFSSSLNTFDIRYPYLRITETLTVKPTKLNSEYGSPSYYIGKASELSGYCECEDIQLKSNCTESEYNEIKDLLKGGVIF